MVLCIVKYLRLLSSIKNKQPYKNLQEMKKLLILPMLLMLSMIALAQQQQVKITGTTLPAATVQLLKSSDSVIVEKTVADADGKFTMAVSNEGKYFLMAEALGFEKKYGAPFDLKLNEQQPEQILTLSRITKQIEAVTVTAKKPLVEYKLDKTILNVDAMVSNTGATALEALEKAPGVIVDKDGKISLKGKQGVVVLLDGKRSYMSGQELSAYLSGLPASTIQNIELMSNPSSKYDAEGNAGIININTKKIKQKGFNGSASLSYGQGFYSKTNNSLNLNYRINKWNFFTNVSANYRKEFQDLNINRKYFDGNKNLSAAFAQITKKNKERTYLSSKIGADYYANKNTIIGVLLTGNSAPSSEFGSSLSLLKNKNFLVDSMVDASRSEKSTWHNAGVNLNLRHTIDTAGTEITADIDVIQYKSTSDQYFDNAILNADKSFRYNDILVGDLPSTINIYSGKVDYTHPLPKNVKLDAGLKLSYVNTNNMANYYNVENDVRSIDWTKTNHFTYQENINAAYLNASTEIKKWGIQIGLRAENTNLEGNQFGNPLPSHPDSSFTRSYTNLFPTTYFSYKLNPKNNFGFSYGRRINRPDYEDLNPFLFFLDKYTSERGNPFLRPVYAHVFEISHNYGRMFNSTLNYTHSKDLINGSFFEEGYNIINSRDNFGSSDNLSLAVNFNKKITKWWQMMVYNELSYQQLKGISTDKDLKIETTIYSANLNNQFKFNSGWSAELGGFYRSRGRDGQIQVNQLMQFQAGVKKEVLKGKGSINLGVRDFTGPMNVTGNLNFAVTQADFSQKSDSRVITLGFNYRFGKPIKGTKSKKTGGADAEQNRVKGG